MGFAKLNREFASELTWPGPNPISAATCIGYGGVPCLPRRAMITASSAFFPTRALTLSKPGSSKLGMSQMALSQTSLNRPGMSQTGMSGEHVRRA